MIKFIQQSTQILKKKTIFYSSNPVEGNRFKFGARTTMKFNPKLRLIGYAAYSSKDQEYKYSGGFEYYFSKKPKDYLSVQYKHDYEIFGKSKNAFMIDNILNTLLNRSPYNKLNMANRLEVNYEKEWSTISKDIFSTKFRFLEN